MSNFRLCLVGVILERMKNKGERMMFLVVWLRVEKMRDFVGTHKFSSPPPEHNLSILERMVVKSGQKYLDKITHIFF